MTTMIGKRPGAKTQNVPQYGAFNRARGGGEINRELTQGYNTGWQNYGDQYLKDASRFAGGSDGIGAVRDGIGNQSGFATLGNSAISEFNRRKREAEAKAEADKYAPIPAPKRDPRIEALMKSQRELAKRFREQMPENIAQEYGEYTRDRSRALAGEREDIAASFNRRGLLNSGMREGASVDAGSKATRDIVNKRLEIGDRYRETADQLDNEPLQTEIALAGGQAEIGQAASQASQAMQKLMLENRLNRQNALESAFEAGGSALGYLFANSGKSNYASSGDWMPGAGSQDAGYNPYLDYTYEGAF